MQYVKIKVLHPYLRWLLWILAVQFILFNISAAIYAYRLTHFYEGNAPISSSNNIFQKTWKLFAGPKFYKLPQGPEPPFPCQSISITTAEGISLNAGYSTVDSAKGCVIFFHGMSVNKSFINDEASMIRQWGYNVLLVDFRSHGKSGGNTSTFGVDETQDVLAAFEFAKSRNHRVILYGGSLGAVTCLKAIAEGTVKPSAVIADMPFDNLHNHLKARARDVGFPQEPFASLVTAWIGLERGFNGFHHDVSSYAKKVTCPVLLQWGEKDRYISRTGIETVFDNLASSQKELIVYGNADHESLLRADPVQWQKKVQGFLTALQ